MGGVYGVTSNTQNIYGPKANVLIIIHKYYFFKL